MEAWYFIACIALKGVRRPWAVNVEWRVVSLTYVRYTYYDVVELKPASGRAWRDLGGVGRSTVKSKCVKIRWSYNTNGTVALHTLIATMCATRCVSSVSTETFSLSVDGHKRHESSAREGERKRKRNKISENKKWMLRCAPARKCQNDFVKRSVIITYSHMCLCSFLAWVRMCVWSQRGVCVWVCVRACTEHAVFSFSSLHLFLFSSVGSFERIKCASMWAISQRAKGEHIAKYKITLYRPCTSKHNFSRMKTKKPREWNTATGWNGLGRRKAKTVLLMMYYIGVPHTHIHTHTRERVYDEKKNNVKETKTM